MDNNKRTMDTISSQLSDTLSFLEQENRDPNVNPGKRSRGPSLEGLDLNDMADKGSHDPTRQAYLAQKDSDRSEGLGSG